MLGFRVLGLKVLGLQVWVLQTLYILNLIGVGGEEAHVLLPRHTDPKP